MNIKFAIVHEVQKEQHSTDVYLRFRNEILPISRALIRLMQQVLSTYNSKTARSYGKFEDEPESGNFESKLREFKSEENADSFVQFTKNAMELLKIRIESSSPATGGYVLIVSYAQSQKEYLFILKLNDVQGSAIDPSTFNINDSIHLEVDKLQLGARICISEWEDKAEEKFGYLSFIKGRSNRNEVSLYFRHFLGCTDVSTAKQDNKNLVRAIKDYCQRKFPQDSLNKRSDAFSFCERKRNNKEDIYLEDLSRYLNPEEPDDFLEFANGDDYRVSSIITPDRDVLRRLKRVYWEEPNIKMNFEESLIGNRIVWNETENKLIINDLPQDVQETLRELSGHAD